MSDGMVEIVVMEHGRPVQHWKIATRDVLYVHLHDRCNAGYTLFLRNRYGHTEHIEGIPWESAHGIYQDIIDHEVTSWTVTDGNWRKDD